MEGEDEKVVVDTYALLAIVYDEVPARAAELLERVRRKAVRGFIPPTVIYEYVVHWLKGRIPAFKDLDEVETYLKAYFELVDLSRGDYVKAAEVKVEGDRALKQSRDPELRRRRLSFIDSTVIASALKLEAPIVTGDVDLSYVAKLKGLEVVW